MCCVLCCKVLYGEVLAFWIFGCVTSKKDDSFPVTESGKVLSIHSVSLLGRYAVLELDFDKKWYCNTQTKLKGHFIWEHDFKF